MDPATLQKELQNLHGESFGWALGCCAQDATEAEDVLQTVYLKILEGRARYNGRSTVKTWLFAVIRNTAADARRREGRRRRHLDGYAAEREPDAQSERADEALEEAAKRLRFRKLLAELPDRQREAMYLVFYHDMSLSEAAAVMQVSLGSARTHYDRGKKRLRGWIEATDDDTRPD